MQHSCLQAASTASLQRLRGALPTATFRVLYVFVVLLHHRRRVVHFNVTDSPTAAWTAQQIVEAFPDDSAPRYLLRDRDGIYGGEFRQRVKGMGLAEVLTARRSPWQKGYTSYCTSSVAFAASWRRRRLSADIPL